MSILDRIGMHKKERGLTMGKTAKKIACWSLAGIAVTTLAGLVITGREIGWGPFRRLFKGFEEEVAGIEKKYPVSDHQHGILFYGASNFRLWTEMEPVYCADPNSQQGITGTL